MSNGRLLFQRDDAILIAAFDTEQLLITGPAVPLIDQVRFDSAERVDPGAQLAVSRNGTLAYLPSTDTASLLGIVGRDGAFEPLELPPGNYDLPRVSPDGRSIAILEARGQQTAIRIYDIQRGTSTRLDQAGSDLGLAWHPDGRALAVARRSEGIVLRSLDGTERGLVPLPSGSAFLRNISWTPDGTQLAYTVQTGSDHDIWVLTVGDEHKTAPLLDGAAQEWSPSFAPDGRWLAYSSDESGRREVYIQRYPEGARLAVSTDGGDGPVWSPDGTEFYFRGLDGGVPKLMAVSVTPDGDGLRLGKPVGLLDARVPGAAGEIEQYRGSDNGGPRYDILPDGERFVMIRGADPANNREIVVVQNWYEELERLIPTQ